MHEEKCNRGEYYIGVADQNVTIRWDEHCELGKNSQPAKHFCRFPDQDLTGKFSEEFQLK